MPKKYNKTIQVQALSNEEMFYLESLGSFEFHEDEKMMTFGKPKKVLDDYEKLANERYEKERLIANSTSFSITKDFHVNRAKLAQFIHAKILAFNSLHMLEEGNESEDIYEAIKKLQADKEFIKDVNTNFQETFKHLNIEIQKLKKEIGLKDGAKAEFEFLKYDKFYRPTGKKTPTTKNLEITIEKLTEIIIDNFEELSKTTE